MKELRYLNKFFFKYRWRLLIGFLFVVASNFFRVLQPKIVREAMDLVVENLQLYPLSKGFTIQQLFFGEVAKLLLFFGILMVILALLMGVFMYFMRQTIIVMSRLIEYDMRKEIFAHYEALDLAFFKRNNTGDLMARITEDLSKVRMYLGPALLYGINLSSLFILVIWSMLNVSVELTLYSLAPLPLLSVSIYYVSNIINKKSTIIQQHLSGLNSLAQEVYSGIRVVKAYVQEQLMGKHFAEQCETYKEKSMDLAKVDAMFYPLMLLLIGASTIITVYIGGLQVVSGKISPGNIAEFVIYVNMLTWPVTAIGWIASVIQQAAASQKRINEFLHTEPTIASPEVAPISLQGAIRFDDVSFKYPDTGIQALQDISFQVKPGQKLAIVGRTGSGKTTIADLLLRMYDVSEGRILLDEKDIRNIHLSSLRQQIGYVPQDVFLFSDTIANNIAFGKADASEQQIEQYARYAAVYDDIMDLPAQFDTLTGERGVTLSGGQKQRVSMARALIKEPKIVILDDALSAVDTNTEQQILSYLNNELNKKTTIVITHRIYALLQFDQIIVLEDGRVAEIGTHEQLLQNEEGYYAQQYYKQLSETSAQQ